MKGLLIKDLKLMKNMRNTLIIIAIVALGMSFYTSDMSFIVVYLAVISTSFTSSTISYDEFENGNAFLFSLPVSRRDYAVEKHLFSLLMCGGGWLAGSVLTVCGGVFRDGLDPAESVMAALVLLPVAIGLSSFMIPVHLKYSGEKGRIVMIILMGGVFLIVISGAKIAEKLGIDFRELGERMPVMSDGMGLAAALGISLVLLLVSCKISIRIMEHKEF